MIIYLATRIFCALYGIAWPLCEENKSLLASASGFEFVALSALSIGSAVAYIIEKKENTK